MKWNGLIIAAIVLAALGGVLYWSQNRKPPAEVAAVAPSATPVMLKVDPSAATQLVIKQKGSDSVTLKKTGSEWEITEPKRYRADQNAVTGVLSTLSTLSADRVVEDKAADRKQYGFEEPAAEVDTGTHQVMLGDDTPAGGDVYAAVAGDARVFTVSSYVKTSLAKSLNDLRDKNLLTVNPDKVSRVELIEKGQDLEFDRTKDGWQIVKPSASPADATAVNDLVRTLTNARMDLTAGATGFAQATPVGTARLTGDAGVQTIEVRKNKDDYYAKSSATEGTYKVESSLGQAFEKKLDDFQAKKKI